MAIETPSIAPRRARSVIDVTSTMPTTLAAPEAQDSVATSAPWHPSTATSGQAPMLAAGLVPNFDFSWLGSLFSAPSKLELATQSMPSAKWSSGLRAAVISIENELVKNTSVPFEVWPDRSGGVVTNVGMPAVYKDGEDKGTQTLVRRLPLMAKDANGVRDGLLTAYLLLPVSGHTHEYAQYARDDRAVVWVRYVDVTSGDATSRIDLNSLDTSTPDPTTPPAGVTILAKDIACAVREPAVAGQADHWLVRVVKVTVPMKANKAAVVMYDSNGVAALADVSGYVAGRQRIFFWDGSKK